ncbi:hypothetical protein [Cellulomonas soli]|uniref:HTH araC/xylS-type domain-containing protein n=1 Tax=Cellulomonas soli TaxID=931535 RepID=A0A512PBG8_9CELL|nr:hypothetical protein [Cellulomonas soli]NYI61027.1 hypothetical protein [Cellulomonas soli]GEP68557.1 hypothetical protein CSO01_12720 [Cellulomonas soli]
MALVEYHHVVTPASIRDVVEHLWVVRHGEGEPEHEVLLPDGRGCVVVAAGEPGRRVDALTGQVSLDRGGVRGIATRPVVRTQSGPSVRVGAQLTPWGLARLSPHALLVDAVAPVATLLGGPAVEACALAADRGDDAGAVGLLADALATAARFEDPELELLVPVLQGIDAQRGLVRAADVARTARVPVPQLHAWTSRHLGVEPAVYLAAVRFSAFVREAVGPGPVRPHDALAAIRWYVQAGYPPREVERFTGHRPVELRRIEQGIAAALAPVA